MRRGQVETIGLVIIVILIVMIGLFFLVFSLGGDENGTEDVFLSMKANNLVNSLRSMSIGNDDFGSKVIDCCSGNLGSCNDVMGTASRAMDYIDEKVKFEVECAYGGGPGSVGDCSTGITSERIVLSSGDRFFATLCRK
jgi:hypothetical protein